MFLFLGLNREQSNALLFIAGNLHEKMTETCVQFLEGLLLNHSGARPPAEQARQIRKPHERVEEDYPYCGYDQHEQT